MAQLRPDIDVNDITVLLAAPSAPLSSDIAAAQATNVPAADAVLVHQDEPTEAGNDGGAVPEDPALVESSASEPVTDAPDLCVPR